MPHGMKSYWCIPSWNYCISLNVNLWIKSFVDLEIYDLLKYGKYKLMTDDCFHCWLKKGNRKGLPLQLLRRFEDRRDRSRPVLSANKRMQGHKILCPYKGGSNLLIFQSSNFSIPWRLFSLFTEKGCLVRTPNPGGIRAKKNISASVRLFPEFLHYP